ncbi:molybdopterin dehydrogenase [Streptomyces abyssalis]|uniref:Molybdopterin dehydrogenase n=1 Tax=Streptomyces abyssalis TaxID=933944 RepID=A0A1E7JHZ6_9ACTN|nr:xanthine dehydrogenase family protein subunit M [Streptomyces abyssalis]OEU86089.1 molybdopterin dehydrogenase [Streptomyces abyssalis]OEU92445.1 molybdopterin dehydrogenase [Streptomyces abyssalis]
MKPAAFTYHRARDVEGAARLLAELGDEAKIIAGGQSLVAMMNFRLARPQHLVDIAGLDGLDGVRTGPDGGLRIGALATHHAVETAPPGALGAGFAVVREAMRWIGHLPIRTRGTVGGSLAHADSTAEWCLLAVLLDAELVARGPSGERRIAAGDFFHGYYTTALEPEEILVEVVFPRPAPNAALTEFAERRGDFAVVAAAVDLRLAPGGGHIEGGRVALGGVTPQPVRVPEAEAVLARGGTPGPRLFAECAESAAGAVNPPSDANGSAQYRRRLIRTLVARACEEATAR